ncbi:DUF6344 domain-containing protein [Streptomyces thermoalcalitolerans]|uniref:DUF6344 domain-containing protein n=1 Tax=Streptomyces thermoalcalitolerans TaxID=65605 RepID=A0ABN1NCW7_9ACTN
MDQNKVMKLWTTIVSAFLALCTALGLITTTASAAAAATKQPEKTSKSTALVPAQLRSPWSRLQARSLPPTMKQRIRAEAHGKTPTCRHRLAPDTPSLDTDLPCVSSVPPARPAIPLQR